MVEQTLKCIRNSMISLLKEKEYSKIQMKEIAEKAFVGRKTLYRYFNSKEKILKYIAESLWQRFATELNEQNEMTLRSVTYAFFSYIWNNRAEFLILKNAKLLSYIEQNLFEMITTQVAVKTKYVGKTIDEVKSVLAFTPIEEKYALHYVLAGYWHIAMIWIEGGDAQTPEQMTEIALKVVTEKMVCLD